MNENLTLADFHHGDTAAVARMKILVVDDEPANLALLEELLGEGGFMRIELVSDSKMVLESCKCFEPDLVLLDLMMPPPDGFKLLDLIRGENDLALLPIIVLTADANEQTKIRALRKGANDFLLKPFDHAEVILRIANALEMRRLHLQLELKCAALADALYARTVELQTP